MSEITTTSENRRPNRSSVVWLLFFATTIFVYLFGLTIPLVGPDEPRYAQVGREMLNRGDWVTPTLGGFHWFEKPALLYWLEMIAYRIFGVSEFAARLGPALFGLGIVLCLWVLGRFVSRDLAANGDPRSAYNFANWLGLAAAATLGIIVFSRGASFDIIITFPMTVSLVSFYIYHQRRGEDLVSKYLPLALFYFFIGVALLAKGLIGFIFPFAIVAFYYVLLRRLPDRTFVISLIWGTVLALAVAAVWYVPVYERNGYAFFNEFIVQHHFQRFTSNKYQHPQPFYFFLWVLPLMTLPWLGFFFRGLWNSAGALFRLNSSEPLADDAALSPLTLFCFAWLLVPLVFFSFSGSKLPGYVLPSVPAAIVITGICIFRLVEKSRGWRIAVAATACATLVATAILSVTIVPRFANADSVRELIAAATAHGYTSEHVLCLHNTSHNAEFYAAGRLLRDANGDQLRLDGPVEVENEIQAGGGLPVLVLVPVEYTSQLTNDAGLTAEVLGDNGDLAIVHAELKHPPMPQQLVAIGP